MGRRTLRYFSLIQGAPTHGSRPRCAGKFSVRTKRHMRVEPAGFFPASLFLPSLRCCRGTPHVPPRRRRDVARFDGITGRGDASSPRRPVFGARRSPRRTIVEGVAPPSYRRETAPIAATSSPSLRRRRRSLHVHAIAARQNAVADAGGAWGLFGLHAVPADATELVITEGEYDAMAVYRRRRRRAAVSRPMQRAASPPPAAARRWRTVHAASFCGATATPPTAGPRPSRRARVRRGRGTGRAVHDEVRREPPDLGSGNGRVLPGAVRYRVRADVPRRDLQHDGRRAPRAGGRERERGRTRG